MDTCPVKQTKNIISYDEAKASLEEILRDLNPDDLLDFSNHLVKKATLIRQKEAEPEAKPAEKPEKPATSIAQRKKERIIEKIRETIRVSLPPDALAPNEAKLQPSSSSFDGFTLENTLHVDSFLYPDDELIDEYCDQGLLARNYCGKCFSREILPLNFISHSMSDIQARFIYDHILPEDMSDMCVVDVGSRLGVLLYYGFLYSNASSLVGVEFNKTFSDICGAVLHKNKMTKRAKVINSDIRDQKELLGNADVVIMNNVFDAFIEKEKQIELWTFILTTITKKGAIIITTPSIESSLEQAQIKTLNVEQYFEKKEIVIPFDLALDEEYSNDVKELFAYTVK